MGLDDPFSFGGTAKGYWPLSPDVHLQVDLFADRAEDIARDFSSDGQDTNTFGAAAHLLHPLDKRARLGVAGSIWSNDLFLPAGDGKADVTFGLIAVEGQFFGTDWTVTGQAGLFSAFSCDAGGESCSGDLEDGTYIRGKVRYYLNDNTALSVEATQMWGSFSDDIFDGKNLKTALWTVEGEHKFQDSQFSGFISLSHENSEVFFVDADTSTVSLGVKFYLDQPTLRSNDQTGAELDTPQFGNAIESAGILFISSP
ncbi:MAG: hypothetical protein ABL996_19335 [Micropepsaceae bacterium]